MKDILKQKIAACRTKNEIIVKRGKKDPLEWKNFGYYELWVNNKNDFILIGKNQKYIRYLYKGKIEKDILPVLSDINNKKNKIAYYIITDYSNEHLYELGYHKIISCYDEDLHQKIDSDFILNEIKSIQEKVTKYSEKIKNYIRKTSMSAPYRHSNENDKIAGEIFYKNNSKMKDFSEINLGNDERLMFSYQRFWISRKMFFKEDFEDKDNYYLSKNK